MKNSKNKITLMSRIWQAAARNPDKEIIFDSRQVWSWRSLLWRAQGYAEALQSFSANSADTPVVPIFVDRSGETIAAILGALISGRGFAPLSAHQPSSRLAHCISALNAELAIFTGGSESLHSDPVLKPLRQVISCPNNGEFCLPPQPIDPDPRQLIYVLFTSGSTGLPKGVMAEYFNIENTMLWSMDMLDWFPEDVIGCATNFFFDISIFDVFSTLYFDIPLAIYSNPSDVTQVVSQTAAFGITSIFAVPTFFSQLLRNGLLNHPGLSSLRRIIAGGDFFPPAHVLAWLDARPEIDVLNVWGPTETSIVNTMHKIGSPDLLTLRQGRPAPVGQAHSRMQFFLIDDSGTILHEANQRGEICMYGDSVTRGYLADPEKTREAYIELEGRRFFRTQDLGYVDQAGKLYLVGRMGSTVKVAGYRIDLCEVETAAVLIPGVYMACAFVSEVCEGHQELWLAIEPQNSNVALNIYSIKKGLRAVLPAYMVPKRVFVLEVLPRNANSKIDRNAIRKIISNQS